MLIHGQKQISLCGNIQTSRVRFQQCNGRRGPHTGTNAWTWKEEPRTICSVSVNEEMIPKKDIYSMAVASGIQRRHRGSIG